ncbi:single-stranded DNA-binding protein [Chryseobacterium sp.]|uniref:single-stranded DNA-binding protein n=1 Tax=Chryseobacterium sp. TaxID=1871047 RepID=UPI00333EE900
MNINGRLTKDATVSKTTTGKEVVNFTIAVNDGYKNKQGEWVDTTEFIDCAFWRTSVVASWLKQGLFVELYGQISTRAWIGKDGAPQAGLTFSTSSIKPAWGTASKVDAVQDYKTTENNSLVNEDQTDGLPF